MLLRFPKIAVALMAMFTALMAFAPETALAAAHLELDGATLSVVWVIPFACMLLSIAIMPLTIPHIWHHHFGKISLFWAAAFAIPCALQFGFALTSYQVLHAVLLEYVPFIVLLFALFTVAGGIRLKGSLVGTPVVNTLIITIGTLLASWMGTTGAAMLLIRPLLRANSHRKYRVHSVVFFIFLVANIGGSLTPLGDPPLFLGFLKGVSFFWTTTHLFVKTLLLSVLLIAIFFIVDTVLYKREGSPKPDAATMGDTGEKLGLEGLVNIPLLGCVIGLVLMSGLWKPGIEYHVGGVHLELQNLVRDFALVAVAGLSLVLTSKECRKRNDFNWEPIEEVGKLFIGIFISMIPAIAILKAGEDGALAPLIKMVFHDGHPDNAMFFWLTGMLSSFLDNAPTYLVFFNTAGGDPMHLMTDMADTLIAISAGAVFMGANTYIGNAPNFMVRSIAENQGVKMPSFFGYMIWSFGILVPCFALLQFLFFH
ncbi:MAG: sodium:proton antiporter [Pseudomonadota bacterium]